MAEMEGQCPYCGRHPAPKAPTVLSKPLGIEEALKIATANDGRLTAVIELDITDLNGDVEALNDLADERIIGEGGTLSDINYRVVGHTDGTKGGHFLSGSIFLEVNAEVQEF